MMRFATAAAIALVVSLASAGKMEAPATEAALDARLKKLETDLRCLVCQNQTLADSNADLADDLRREVRALAVAGKSDDEIKAYLVARYGDFVLYDPPVKPLTWFLWFGPFALAIAGGAVWWVVLKRRAQMAPKAADTDALTRGRKLLDDEEER
jgi:cytochrome c-type biogenesis protein CcmH